MSSLHGRWILSGRLASGKSWVRNLLEGHGVHTIDADSIGHRVLEPDGPGFASVAARWPEVVVAGKIDRSKLAAIVFQDSSELRALESITHPYIFDTIQRVVEEIGEHRVVVEIPLLGAPMGDEWRRIVVDATTEACLERAVSRGMSRSDAETRLGAQPSRREWLSVADIVLPNHETADELRDVVDAVVAHL